MGIFIFENKMFWKLLYLNNLPHVLDSVNKLCLLIMFGPQFKYLKICGKSNII